MENGGELTVIVLNVHGCILYVYDHIPFRLNMDREKLVILKCLVIPDGNVATDLGPIVTGGEGDSHIESIVVHSIYKEKIE